MRKILFRGACVLLCFCLIFTVPACHTAYKVTGKIEKGDMVIWYSPRVSAYYDTNTDQSLGYFDYGDEVQAVYFKSNEDFQNALEQRLLTDRCPDLIIAFGDEISPKLLCGDNFADLNLFWDYQDSLNIKKSGADKILYTTGNLQRNDILPPVLNMCRIGNKLPAMPLNLSLWSYVTTPADDSKYGLGLMGENNTLTKAINKITESEKQNSISLDDVINEYKPHNGAFKSMPKLYYTFDKLPDINNVFTGFVDFNHRSTRMGENITYDYFCAYALVNKRIETWKTEIVKSQNPQLVIDKVENIEQMQMFLNWYNLCATYIYGSCPELSDISVGALDSGSLGCNRITAYYAQNKDTRACSLTFPSDTGNTIYADTHNTMIAAIPANAKRPYKAFSYIQVFLSSSYTALESKQLMNMDILNKIFETLKLPKNIETDLRQKITGAKYAWSWSDPQIDEWFNTLLYNKDGTPRADLPTRAEWDAVKNKVEIYLNE